MSASVPNSTRATLDALYRVFQTRHLLEYVCYACGEFICGWGYCHNANCEDAGALVQCNCWIRGPYALRKHEGVVESARALNERKPGLTIERSLEAGDVVELIRDLTIDVRLLQRTRALENPFLRGRRSPRMSLSSKVLQFPGIAPGAELEVMMPAPGEALRPAPDWINRPDTPDDEWDDEEPTAKCATCGELLCTNGHCHAAACTAWNSPRECACWHDETLAGEDVDLLAHMKSLVAGAPIDAAVLSAALELIDRLSAQYARMHSSMAF